MAAHQLEDRMALELFDRDPSQEPRGHEYQAAVDGARDIAHKRVLACLDLSNDDSRNFVKETLFSKGPAPEKDAIEARAKSFLAFRDMVRSKLGDGYLLGNIYIDEMSLGNEQDPCIAFTIYRHPSVRGERSPYHLKTCMNIATGEMLLGLTKNEAGYHLDIPISVNNDNFDSVRAKLEELGSNLESVASIRRGLYVELGIEGIAGFWSTAHILANRFGLETTPSSSTES